MILICFAFQTCVVVVFRVVKKLVKVIVFLCSYSRVRVLWTGVLEREWRAGVYSNGRVVLHLALQA